MQPVHVVRTRSQPVKPKVAAFMGKIECEKYPKAVWNSMTNEHKMQVRKLGEQQGIKPNEKEQTCIEARINAFEEQLRGCSQPKENQHGGETEGIVQLLARYWEVSARNPDDS